MYARKGSVHGRRKQMYCMHRHTDGGSREIYESTALFVGRDARHAVCVIVLQSSTYYSDDYQQGSSLFVPD